MTVALRSVALAVPSLSSALERLGNLGLPAVEIEGSSDEAGVRCVGVGRQRLELWDRKALVSLESAAPGPFPFITLSADSRAAGRALGAGLRKDRSAWLTIDALGATVRIVEHRDVECSVGDTGLFRIESLPWAVTDRARAREELHDALGIDPSPDYSDLVFPELRTTNTLFFLGDESYLDANESIDGRGPIAKQVADRGSGQFAIVLEPRDLDQAVAQIRQRGVPTLTPAPVELGVRWRDGTDGIAARILAIDPSYLFGARVFISEPTFPWPLNRKE